MKYFIFKRENDKFDDILNDPVVKKQYKTKMRFLHHLVLGFPICDEEKDTISSFIVLKYGDDIIIHDAFIPDRTPISGKDYQPKRKAKV